MALHLVIANKTYSSWSLRPWLLLRQFEVPFVEERIALRGAEFAARMERLGVAGKVPVLLDGERVVWDSLAICEYLHDTVLAGRAWPQDLAARTYGRCIVAEMHSGFSAMRNELGMNLRRQRALVEGPSAAASADVARVLSIWAEALQRFCGPFLLGEFSVADAFFAPVVTRLQSYCIEVPAGPVLDWMQRMRGLPAMQQWTAEALTEVEVIADYEQL